MSDDSNDFEAAFIRAFGALPHQTPIARIADYIQHGSVSTLAHTTRVAKASLRLARALRISVNECELVRGAILHDYYLYDWHEPGHKGHAMQHPLRAEANALRDFNLNAKERNIIVSHMWPFPPTRVPASREAWLVCTADKYCSIVEIFFMRKAGHTIERKFTAQSFFDALANLRRHTCVAHRRTQPIASCQTHSPRKPTRESEGISGR